MLRVYDSIAGNSKLSKNLLKNPARFIGGELREKYDKETPGCSNLCNQGHHSSYAVGRFRGLLRFPHLSWRQAFECNLAHLSYPYLPCYSHFYLLCASVNSFLSLLRQWGLPDAVEVLKQESSLDFDYGSLARHLL
jgi:hypothetical protein